MSAQSLINQGFYGYQGWGDAEADANFAATGGAGKGGLTGGTSSLGGFQPVSAPDLAKLRGQAAEILKDYYIGLAKNAEGDFDTAIKAMRSDYEQGTRQDKEKQMFAQKYGTAELDNALKTLGLDFVKENESLTDSLNKRGMAVGQNSPDGQANVVQTASFNPTFDPNKYTSNTGFSGTNPNTPNLGRGGVEAERLRQAQSLRAEATMRAGIKPLEAAGMTLKQSTNPQFGFDINNVAQSAANLSPEQISQLGSSEKAAINNYNTNRQQLRNTRLNIGQQYQGAISDLSNQAANTQGKALTTDLGNQYQKELTSDFLKGGIT